MVFERSSTHLHSAAFCEKEVPDALHLCGTRRGQTRAGRAREGTLQIPELGGVRQGETGTFPIRLNIAEASVPHQFCHTLTAPPKFAAEPFDFRDRRGNQVPADEPFQMRRGKQRLAAFQANQCGKVPQAVSPASQHVPSRS